MKHPMIKCVFLTALLGMSAYTHSAEWQLETIDSRPGASAEMTLSLTGDGVTKASVVEIYFDEARLQLPNRRGEIPGASRNGALCSRNADNRIDVFQYDDARPLPAGQNAVLCTAL